MTTLTPGGTAPPAPAPGAAEHVQGVARREGLAPALAALGAAVLPGLLPCGPAGHAMVDARTHAEADGVWIDGRRRPRDPRHETVLAETAVPGGTVVTLRVTRPDRAAGRRPDAVGAAADTAYATGLVRLRLGLSEGLRDACVAHLAHRRSGDTTLLQQQLVKGTVADVLVEHLEARAVLTGADPAELAAGLLHHLHRRITAADREQIRLLGASGYLMDGPGLTAYLSELLAEAHDGTAPTGAGAPARAEVPA